MQTELFEKNKIKPVSPPVECGAYFSTCRKYRYALWRVWDRTKPFLMFVGLNPSTANEASDDPTIRRVKSMAANWGYGGVYMMNCFPLVSTDPTALIHFKTTPFHDVEYEINNQHLKDIASMCKDVIFAWGAFDVVKELKRDIELVAMFPEAKALIINKDGSPRHPLYVPSSVIPISFNKINK